MKKVQLIFCSDFNFQIIQVLPNSSSEDAWDHANELFADLPELGESYDVATFDTMEEMNSYVLEQCKENQKYTLDNTPAAPSDKRGPLANWDVQVTRVGIGFNTIEVEAHSEKEAVDLALEEAGSVSFSDNSSEYTAPDGALKL